MAFDKTAYDIQFHKQTYDRIYLQVPKGRKEEIRRIAEKEGISLNQCIVNALEAHYHIDLSKF